MLGVVASRSMGMRWKLKVVMADRDMSARKLAEKTGLTYGAIVKLRNETPKQVTVSTLTAICHALDCTPDELMEITEDGPDPKK